MMRSMFSGVSGLKAHQTRMDVIGNNVANVNTVGFKGGRVTFADVFSQTSSGAGAPEGTGGRGGTNPKQIGLGTSVGAIANIMTSGSVQTTDNPTDLAIAGEGFFVVKSGNNDSYKFTRAGNFQIDQLGNLTAANGANVYGWMDYTKQSDGSFEFATSNKVEPINIFEDPYNNNKRAIAPQKTTLAKFSGNLDTRNSLKAPYSPIPIPLTPIVAPVTVAVNYISDIAPTSLVAGEKWYDTTNASIWTSGAGPLFAWGAAAAQVGGTYFKDPANNITELVSTAPNINTNIYVVPPVNVLRVGATYPSNPIAGDRYLNTNDGNIYNYNGTTKAWDTPVAALAQNYMDSSNGNIYKVTTGPFAINLSRASDFVMPMTVYDTKGNPYNVNIVMNRQAADPATNETSWEWEMLSPTGTTAAARTTGYVKFDAFGKMITNSAAYNASPTVTITPTDNGLIPFTVSLDLTNLTEFASDSSAKATNVDGYESGNIVTFNISPDGVINGVYSNGQQKPLGLLGIAKFDNPAGLQKAGDNLFMATANSGTFENGTKPGSAGTGTLSPGALEMSNVDLSKEFTDMIITQRGFQANSKIITTSDEMLQELVNLKR